MSRPFLSSFLVLALSWAASGSGQQLSPRTLPPVAAGYILTPQQAELCQLRKEAMVALGRAKAPFGHTVDSHAVLQPYADRVGAIFGSSMSFKDWVGVVRVSLDFGGKTAHLSFHFTCDHHWVGAGSFVFEQAQQRSIDDPLVQAIGNQPGQGAYGYYSGKIVSTLDGSYPNPMNTNYGTNTTLVTLSGPITMDDDLKY